VAFYVAVAIGGFVGAPSRYLADRAVTRRYDGTFPWGTIVINVSGSLLLGFLTGLGLIHVLPRFDQALVGTGFCGAYTTFSTFAYETVRLVEDGRVARAGANVVASMALGLAAAAAGLWIGLAL
jgi:fluoride exporter